MNTENAAKYASYDAGLFIVSLFSYIQFVTANIL